jgi:hypothetical protein
MTLTTTFPAGRVMAAAGIFGLCLTLGCGSSNAERPYADGGGPSAGTGGSTGGGANPDESPARGGAPGPGSAGNGPSSGGAPGAVDGGNSAGEGGGGAAGGGAGNGDGAAGGTGGSLSGGDAAIPAPDSAAVCAPVIVPACDAPVPAAGDKRSWHSIGSAIVAGAGSPRHRGHDLFLVPDAPQWLIARFAYGLFDASIVGEEVDLFLLRGCGTTWEPLGTAITTGNGEHAEVEGVADPGGRVYFSVPADKRLGPGRHRVRFVVAGDGSSTEVFVEVRPAGTAVAVVDVDGTLTTSETAEFGALLTGQLPAAQPDAARALGLLPTAGYRLLYLTARPEWLTERTREFLAGAGFPPGIIETTTGGSGALGADATKFKTDALARISAKGLRPALAIGNTDSDAAAYAAANIQPAQSRIFFKYTDSANGGRRIESYADVVDDFNQRPPVCR